MPRERTYAYHDPTWNPDSEPPTRPGVDVTWTRDGETVGLATGWLTDAPYDDSDRSRDRVTAPYHVWLTRAEVNLLVRRLRRARDAAFGADE